MRDRKGDRATLHDLVSDPDRVVNMEDEERDWRIWVFLCSLGDEEREQVCRDGPARAEVLGNYPDETRPAVARAWTRSWRRLQQQGLLPPPRRQAVIVIHGIGEQRPMQTLRAFVETMVGKSFSSKPDHVSQSFELRRLRASRPENRFGGPDTDFYEFYWAHRIQNTRFWHVLDWFFRLLRRRPPGPSEDARDSGRLLALWEQTWTFLVVLAAALFGVVWAEWAGRLQVAGMVTGSVGLILLWVTVRAILSAAILRVAGDAARYLNPASENVAARQRIRQDGMLLLQELHRNPAIERIIVVGHSLGSVIGYDILKHFWIKVQPQVWTTEKLAGGLAVEGYKLRPERVREGDLPGIRSRFRRLQVEHCRGSWQWRVTDFITVGSPLTYGDYLLAPTRAEFDDLVRQRELPACPPAPATSDDDAKKYAYEESSGIWRFHHAAAFALTRWTNLYFPGDWVGGRLRHLFGGGIKDVKLQGGGGESWIHDLSSHTRYWSSPSKASTDLCVRTLRRLIGVEPENTESGRDPGGPSPASGSARR